MTVKALRLLLEKFITQKSGEPLHWVLDVGFNEDDSRIRKDNALENLAIIRHIALNLLKQDKNEKESIRSKRNRAGWDNDYLLDILSN